ncbi:MAG TPA: L,D-transpeptidase family protein [Candidatus Binatia bacterium]|nr:L,D-transpeptidase family protein [Candidatus Binatia bacterium]
MKSLRHSAILELSLLVTLVILTDAFAADRAIQSLSNAWVGREFVHTVQKGQSLAVLGARFGVEASVLAANNGLRANAILKEGQTLRIDNRHIVPNSLADGILINIPQRMLFHMRQGQAIYSYAVGLGRPDWPTPAGKFTVITKEENPTWDVPKSIQEEMRREGKVVQQRVPPCPENPLGKHWMGLSIPGYGIHGTIAPTSIYQFRTHGCIRLHPNDIAELFAAISTGTPGLLLYQRLLLARLEDRIFLEVHRDVYRKDQNPLDKLLAIVKTNNLEPLLDWEAAKAIIAKQEGVAREVTKAALR